MPYQSEAQRAKFHALAAEGKISAETLAEWDKASEGKRLPKRLHPKKKPKAERKGW